MTNPHKVLTTWTKLKHNIHTKLEQEAEKLTNLKKSFTDLQQENKLFLTQQQDLNKTIEQKEKALIDLNNKADKFKKIVEQDISQQLQQTYFLLDESKENNQEVNWAQLQNKIKEFLVDYQKVVKVEKKGSWVGYFLWLMNNVFTTAQGRMRIKDAKKEDYPALITEEGDTRVGYLILGLFKELMSPEEAKDFLPYDDNKTFLELMLYPSRNPSPEIVKELQKLLDEYRQTTNLKTSTLNIPGKFPPDNNYN